MQSSVLILLPSESTKFAVDELLIGLLDPENVMYLSPFLPLRIFQTDEGSEEVGFSSVS